MASSMPSLLSHENEKKKDHQSKEEVKPLKECASKNLPSSSQKKESNNVSSQVASFLIVKDLGYKDDEIYRLSSQEEMLDSFIKDKLL